MLLAAPSADARSVTDPDIGWPTALRKDLHLPKVASARECTRRTTKAMIRLQDRVERRDPRDHLSGLLHYSTGSNVWSSLWYDPCQGGRLIVGVASGGAPRDVRKALRRSRDFIRKQGQTRDVRFVAVRSTYKQLSDATDAFVAAFRDLVDSEDLSVGTDTSRNTLEVDVPGGLPDAARARLHEYARTAPVNVVLHFEPAPDPAAPIQKYDASFSLDRAKIDRAARTVEITIDDSDCAADETNDTAARLAGVRVTQGKHAYVLVPRLRVNPDWPRFSTCEGNLDSGTSVTTTVALPGPLGNRGIVDGTKGPGDFRPVRVPPVGAAAIRSLVPRFLYAGDLCEDPAVRRAFARRTKDEWCFF